MTTIRRNPKVAVNGLLIGLMLILALPLSLLAAFCFRRLAA